MTEFDKILEISSDKTLDLTDDIKKLLGTELHLGMSDYVCKNGTLSEGFEKITNAQRYIQAVKECWTYGCNIKDTKAISMEAQARFQYWNLLYKLFFWVPILGLYLKAKQMMATYRISSLLVTIQDQMRIFKAFDEVRRELMPEFREKYGSIEAAEKDNWEAVLKYRIARQKIGKQEHINHVPVPMKDKARIGLSMGAPEAVMWLAVEKEEEINDKFSGNIDKYLEVQTPDDEKVLKLKKGV